MPRELYRDSARRGNQITSVLQKAIKSYNGTEVEEEEGCKSFFYKNPTILPEHQFSQLFAKLSLRFS